MTMLFVSSFDYLATADISKIWSFGGSPTIGTGRNSTNGMRCPSGTAAISRGMGNQTTIVMGCAFKIAALPSATAIIMSFLDSVSHQCEVEITTSGTLQIARNGTVLSGPGATVLSTGVFYYLEFKATINNTTGSATLKINGTQELTVSGVDTQNTANAFADTFYLGNANANTDWDDLYVCNTSGAKNNDFLGDLRIQCRFPNANGGNSAWTPSTGTDHFAVVDEATPNDDTDYMSDSVIGDRDSWGYEDLTPTVGNVKAVQTLNYLRKDDAGTRTVAPVVRISGVNYDQSNLPNLSTTYQYLPQILETSPATAANWTIAEVNGTEFGWKVIA